MTTTHDLTSHVHLGDCLEYLRTLPSDSVDSIVTDPPYGLAFMGKRWDYDVPGVEIWQECLRVLKPGGHLLAFAGTRTQHRMAVRIEDAGFEIRDMIAWVYGSGFPKSHDVSKAIDKVGGEVDRMYKFTSFMRSTGVTAAQINKVTGTFMASHYLTDKSQPAIPTPELWEKIRPLCGEIPAWVDQLVERIEAERQIIGKKIGNDTRIARPACAVKAQNLNSTQRRELEITAPATEAAQQWDGWGTALKPAMEPITVARKPLAGTVADNVQRYGTGGLNIDGCRVGTELRFNPPAKNKPGGNSYNLSLKGMPMEANGTTISGRWPANLIHDGSDEVVGLFPHTTNGSIRPYEAKSRAIFRQLHVDKITSTHTGDSGSAARFFYCAKASPAERGEFNLHPTVKPVELIRYLQRLVTPPDGLTLDPFLGSGTARLAARAEGFHFIGCEREATYYDIQERRYHGATYQPTTNTTTDTPTAISPRPQVVQTKLF